ncbi:hypothetical protein HYS48_00050 [Candidatus Woesearchaeota archaeon]|nr:hypothetical protein [Candidatus Woesearchaeota archaeon]
MVKDKQSEKPYTPPGEFYTDGDVMGKTMARAIRNKEWGKLETLLVEARYEVYRRIRHHDYAGLLNLTQCLAIYAFGALGHCTAEEGLDRLVEATQTLPAEERERMIYVATSLSDIYELKTIFPPFPHNNEGVRSVASSPQKVWILGYLRNGSVSDFRSLGEAYMKRFPKETPYSLKQHIRDLESGVQGMGVLDVKRVGTPRMKPRVFIENIGRGGFLFEHIAALYTALGLSFPHGDQDRLQQSEEKMKERGKEGILPCL